MDQDWFWRGGQRGGSGRAGWSADGVARAREELGPLLVAGALGGTAFLIGLEALERVRDEGLAPTATLESVRENARWLKSHLT
jgi:hypothetical protein